MRKRPFEQNDGQCGAQEIRYQLGGEEAFASCGSRSGQEYQHKQQTLTLRDIISAFNACPLAWNRQVYKSTTAQNTIPAICQRSIITPLID